MRTLLEIVEDCKTGNRPDYEELRYSLLVFVFMFGMDHRALLDELLTDGETPTLIRRARAGASFDMYKAALEKSPKEYLGWENDPDNPEYQKLRKTKPIF